jgi:hypothetical protein
MTKQFIQLFSAALLSTAFISCGSKKEEAIVAPQGMHVLDLSRFGKPFAIFVPDTTAAKFEIIEQPSGALDIKVGRNFALSINEQAADMELRKKDIKEDEVNKFKSYVAEEPNAIFWESAITQPEFHFITNQKIGTTDYSFEDIRDPEANPLGKDAIQRMFDSSKTIKEVKKENHS